MSRFDAGWIKFHRRAVTEDIGWNGVQLAVWVTLLCWASRFESKIQWQGEQRTLPPGTVVTAIRDLGARLKLSKDAVGRALRTLKKRDSIRMETAPRGTLITICNWAEYQQQDEVAATPARHERETSRTLAGRQPDLNGEVENKRRNTRRSRAAYDQAFEEIYGKYPRKEGKAGGHKIYLRLSDEEKRQLPVAIANYARRKTGTEVQYLKHFGTFMGEWRDWLDPETGSAVSVGNPSINVTPLNLESL
jgi:hypothetical protein